MSPNRLREDERMSLEADSSDNRVEYNYIKGVYNLRLQLFLNSAFVHDVIKTHNDLINTHGEEITMSPEQYYTALYYGNMMRGILNGKKLINLEDSYIHNTAKKISTSRLKEDAIYRIDNYANVLNIMGTAGAGKTRMLEWILKLNEDADVHIFGPSSKQTSKIKELYGGEAEVHNNMSDIMKFKKSNGKHIIVLDEAGRLTDEEAYALNEKFKGDNDVIIISTSDNLQYSPRPSTMMLTPEGMKLMPADRQEIAIQLISINNVPISRSYRLGVKSISNIKDAFALLDAKEYLSNVLKRNVDIGTFQSMKTFIKNRIIKDFIYV
jgi:hypothetical protein